MRPGRTSWILVCLGVVVAACGGGSPPSAETEALEQWLLGAGDAAAFTETYRGTAAFDAGKVCPASDYTIPEHGAVRVELVTGPDSGEISLTEVLWVVEPGGMDVLFTGLEAAYSACDGEQWMDYGDLKTFTVVEGPAVGDARLAAVLRFGDDPDLIRWERGVTVRKGNVLAEFVLAEEAPDLTGSAISDDEFDAIVSDGVDKLPD